MAKAKKGKGKASVTVTGNEEVVAAMREFHRNFDVPEASVAAGEAILPEVRAASRKESGAMRAGFSVKEMGDGAAFLNSEYYFGFQEFGTEFIEPTHAIFLAWEQAADKAVEAYADAARDAAEDAGWKQDFL